MVKISVMYVNKPGARFDHEYFRDRHMPLVMQRLGSRCVSYTIDRGLAGRAPGLAAPFAAMSHILCESVEAFHSGLEQHAAVLMGDIRHYTDMERTIQVSEVVVG